MDNKYQRGKIYKITDIGYNKCYIGSTTEELSQRMTKHRHAYKSQNERKKMNSFQIFDEYGVENCKIEIIEYYPCNTKAELERREGEHIRNNECVNKVVPGRTKQEYRDTHKEETRETNKIYRETNKEMLSQKDKEYYAQNKEKIIQQNRQRYEENKETINKERREKYKDESVKEKISQQGKIYRENNKEQVLERKRVYYQQNKEYLKQKAREYKEQNKDKVNERRRQLRKEKKLAIVNDKN